MANRKTSNKRSSEFHGALLVDKPSGMTSHDVVDRVRRIFQTRRVGHTGTLDPQATGLLVVLLGEATKISEYLMGHDKSYEGTIEFGKTSDTYDAEGEITITEGAKIPTDIEDVQEAATDLTGEIEQTPPPYSAKKVGGKKLYEYAREGKTPKVKSRTIQVDDFEILTYKDGIAEFGVDCSTGTYVRSLVHEMGQALGCGGILTELRRTDVGPFKIENANTLDDLQKIESKEELAEKVMPIPSVMKDTVRFFLAPGSEKYIRNGQAIPHSLVHHDDDAFRPANGDVVLLCRVDGITMALARVDPAPMSPPPKTMQHPTPPWYQPIKQFDIQKPSEAVE